MIEKALRTRNPAMFNYLVIERIEAEGILRFGTIMYDDPTFDVPEASFWHDLRSFLDDPESVLPELSRR